MDHNRNRTRKTKANKKMKIYFSFVFFITFPIFTWSLFCWWNRCCPEKNVIIEGLERNLSSTVFGQHLVSEPILSALSYHVDQPNPKKALVLSFNGPPGVGKTYVARKIAHHFFNGDTRNVKFYSGRNDFLDNSGIAVHKAKLSEDIKKTVYSCPYSIFIFDECDQMSDGLFDVLKPFMDYHNEYQGVDYRRAIFIFLSNIGTSEISKISFDNNLKEIPREALQIQDFEDVLSNWLYNKPGGFKESTLLVGFLVDWYIPFLPLEKSHVEQCIKLALYEHGVQPKAEIISYVYDLLPKKKWSSLEYVPSNCKKIHGEVGKYVTGLERKSLRSRDEM